MLNPWVSTSFVDYENIVNEFGIENFSDILGSIESPARLMKRGVVFSHRDFGKMVPLINGKKDFAVMTGLMLQGESASRKEGTLLSRNTCQITLPWVLI